MDSAVLDDAGKFGRLVREHGGRPCCYWSKRRRNRRPHKKLFRCTGLLAGCRRTYDAAEIATRHDVSVYIPNWMTGVETKLNAPVERFGSKLADTGYEAFVVRDSTVPPWQEAGLFNADNGTLIIPESVGTASYFVTEEERLGVHPMLRLFPPTEVLSQYRPARILVGHGEGILSDADRALQHALSGSRGKTPKLYGKTLKSFLPL